MPQKKVDQFGFGGVDSRSNPANYPGERLLRCRNWTPLASGQLRLRYGFTKPTQSGGGAGAIHSAAYYEQYAGPQFVLFGQGTALKQMAIATGAITAVGTLTSGNAWGHFRAANRIFIGNGTDFQSWDGTTLRPVGIRIPSGSEAAPVNANWTSAAGTFATTVLSGYQFYMCYFNPNTGHVGNRFAIGSRLQVNTASGSVILTGLPNLSTVNTEWVKGIGRTLDNGQIPYWLVDGSGNRIVVGNAATAGTLTSSVVDQTQELPINNGVPPALSGFTKVVSKIFGIVAGDVNLHYSVDDTDTANANAVGVPAESWPPTSIEPFPTGQVPTACHTYSFEGWFFSRNHLAIWSNLLFQQGTNPWRGPWPAGCAGQRAFVETPYGPFWLTPDKQLMMWDGNAPVPASEEYEATLLQKIGDQFVAQVELAYYRNADLAVDRIYIKALDVNSNPLLIMHDFRLKDFRAGIGQGYEAIYQGMTPNTMVGCGYEPRQNVRDINGREKLWTGATDGNLYQLEDGTSDNGANYTGDAIFLINAGDGKPLVDAIEWQGDSNVQVSYSTKVTTNLADFTTAESRAVEIDNPDNRYEVEVVAEARWVYARFQLTSHPADGNFAITDPPFVPMPTYGLLNVITPKFGKQRPEAP